MNPYATNHSEGKIYNAAMTNDEVKAEFLG